MKKLLLASALCVLAAPAYAGLIDWNFGQHPGLLGDTQSFTADGISLLARGFTGSDIGTALFSKTDGGDESGLGLHNDPSHANEITGRNFVQLNVDGPLADRVHNFEFSMGSTTQGEGWKVFGSNDAHPFQFTLLAQNSGDNDEGIHSLAGGFDNYSFFYSGAGPNKCGRGCGANVLVSSFGGVTAIPEPKTWAMMLLGFGILAFFGARKTRSGRFATL